MSTVSNAYHHFKNDVLTMYVFYFIKADDNSKSVISNDNKAYDLVPVTDVQQGT